MSKETFWTWLLVVACLCAFLSGSGPLGMFGVVLAMVLALSVLILMLCDMLRREGDQ